MSTIDDLLIDLSSRPKPRDRVYSEVDLKYLVTDRFERIETAVKDNQGKSYAKILTIEKPERNPWYSIGIDFKINPDKTIVEAHYDLRHYPSERRRMLLDFTNLAEKRLTIFPKSFLGNILGFTYLGENNMGRRDDLFGDLAREVDIHEAIHTHCEYETRRLVEWILSKNSDRYIR